MQVVSCIVSVGGVSNCTSTVNNVTVAVVSCLIKLYVKKSNYVIIMFPFYFAS